MIFSSIAQTSQPQPVLETKGLDYGSLALSTFIVLGASSFLVKWLFGQVVASWEKRIGGIETRLEGLQKESGEIARLNDQQQQTIGTLGRTLEQINSQLQQVTEATRQMALLGERQNVFDQRLQNFGGALQDTQRLITESQKEYLALKADLTANYLRREDWTRFANILESKLEENNRRMTDLKELFIARGAQ